VTDDDGRGASCLRKAISSGIVGRAIQRSDPNQVSCDRISLRRTPMRWNIFSEPGIRGMWCALIRVLDRAFWKLLCHPQ
jgi:hypothetical protein